MSDEEMKASVKQSLTMYPDYSQNDILEALLMNDSIELVKMRERCTVLRNCYKSFISEIESGDEKRRNDAIAKFKRPDR